jgi:hypothetical protein
MTRINNESDIVIETSFSDKDGNLLPIPDYDFEFTYFVTIDKVMKAGKRDTTFYNCYPSGDKVIVILNAPLFGIGALKCKKIYEVPDSRFPDGYRREVEIGIIAKIC